MATKAPTPAQAPPDDEPKPGIIDQTSDGEGSEDAAGADRADATVEARIMIDHLDFECNTLAMLTPDEAEAGEKAGWCTTHEDEVAYIKDLAA
jgi:hypothetical protein